MFVGKGQGPTKEVPHLGKPPAIHLVTYMTKEEETDLFYIC